VGVGFVFAILSWKYVETPFRQRKIGAARKSMFLYAGTGLSIVLIGGLLCISMKGFPQRIPKQAQEIADAKLDMGFINELTIDDSRAGKLVPIGVTNPALPPAGLVGGDSHAMAALPAVDDFLKEQGLSGRAATHSATLPVLNWFRVIRSGLGPDAVAFNEGVFAYIRNQRIPTVILIANWKGYVESGKGSPGSFDASLVTTIRQLVAIGARPWVLLSVPIHSFDVPRVLSRAVISHADKASFETKVAAGDGFDLIAPKTITEIRAAGGRILDPKPRFLDPTGQLYIFQANGVVLYRDEQHLTTKGAKLMLVPLFREELTLSR
jgi:hypothetical protein